MKFLVVRELDLPRWVSSEAIRLGTIPHGCKRTVFLLATAQTVKEDFGISDDCPVVHSTDSIQIRPKLVYKDNKGYYYMKKPKKNRFNDDEAMLIEANIYALKERLADKYPDFEAEA